MQTTQCYEQSMVGIIAYRSISLRKHVVSHAMQITLFDPKKSLQPNSKHLKKPWKFHPGSPTWKPPHHWHSPAGHCVPNYAAGLDPCSQKQIGFEVPSPLLGSQPPGISDGEVRDNEERLHTPGAWRGLLCSPLISGATPPCCHDHE